MAYVRHIYIYFRRNKVYASWKLYKTSISVNCGSYFQVRFVWQVWDGQLSPSFKYIRFKIKLLEGGNATGVRQSSMLGFYGERVCRRRNQTCSLWEAQQAQLLSYQCIYSFIHIHIYIYIYIYISTASIHVYIYHIYVYIIYICSIYIIYMYIYYIYMYIYIL